MKRQEIKHTIAILMLAICLISSGFAGLRTLNLKAAGAELSEVTTNAAAMAEPAEPAVVDAAAMAEPATTDANSVTEPEVTTDADSTNAPQFTLESVPEFTGIAYADINDDIPFFTEEELSAETFQEYWPLDSLGRCTGAYACIGPELLPEETRGSTAEIKPTGWHSVKYEGIDGGYLYNRCHLIGYQLTGQNIEERNIITGTRYMNVEGMLPFENSVRMYVEGTGNHVLYRVRPYYRGDDLVAAGVLMEAKSIEDPLVQFCAFCYNVQPGIEIDYATGESAEADSLLTIVADPATEQDRSSTRAADGYEITYILNTNTMKFHYPYCKSVGDMKEKNKQETTMSREEIIEKGYKPCKNCNP